MGYIPHTTAAGCCTWSCQCFVFHCCCSEAIVVLARVGTPDKVSILDVDFGVDGRKRGWKVDTTSSSL